MYYIELYSRNFETAPQTPLRLRPLRYSSMAVGGYEYAEIAIDGTSLELMEALRWLRFYVIIRNEYFNVVWAGIVTEATVNLGGISIGKTLDGMTNRIAVAYTYNDANGLAVRETTPWANNAEAQARYGIIERLESQGDMESAEALQLRDRALDTYGQPIATVNISAGSVGGTLRCRGLWGALGWKLYNQPGGVVRYEDTGSYEHLLGWGFTANTIGFDEWEDKIHDLNGRLKPLREDDYIVVSGATNGGNNGTFKVLQRAFDEPQSITGTAIRFEASDDILDSASGLGFVDSYQLLQVSGSSVGGNNRYYFSKDQNAADHITVNPNVTASSAGPSVTVAQGHSVGLEGVLTTEYPAANVTLTALGSVVAQSFTLGVDVPFTVAEIYIRVRREGNPTDSIRVGLRADSGGSPSGVDLEVVTILGSNLGDKMTWVKFSSSNTTALTYGATYWLLVSRTGAHSATDYYVTELNEDAGYASGQAKLWNGSAWANRAVAADMPFQIWAWRQTTDQIADMLTSANQLLSGYEVRDASGIYKRQFRDQDQTAQVEIENLLKVGTASSRLLARVAPERVAQVYAEPVADADKNLMLSPLGRLTDNSGQELEPGRSPVGQWVQLTGVLSNVDELEKISPLFVERAEWDCEQEQFSALEFKGAENPWEAIRLL